MTSAFVNVPFRNHSYILCLNLFSRYESFKNCITRLLRMHWRLTVKANTTSLPAWTNSRCMALTRSGCSKTTSGALLPRWRYPRLSNSHMYPSATKIASPEFKRSKKPEYWMHHNEFLLISNLIASSYVGWLSKADRTVSQIVNMIWHTLCRRSLRKNVINTQNVSDEDSGINPRRGHGLLGGTKAYFK